MLLKNQQIKLTKQIDQTFGPLSYPVQYVVVYNEAWGRWVGAWGLNEAIKRDDFKSFGLMKFLMNVWTY